MSVHFQFVHLWTCSTVSEHPVAAKNVGGAVAPVGGALVPETIPQFLVSVGTKLY